MNIFIRVNEKKGFPNQYQLFNWSDLYNVIVCKRNENAHVWCMFHLYYKCESMENLARHTFVLVNARFSLHIQKRLSVYENVKI